MSKERKRKPSTDRGVLLKVLRTVCFDLEVALCVARGMGKAETDIVQPLEKSAGKVADAMAALMQAERE